MHERQLFGVVARCYAIAFGGVLVRIPAGAMADGLRAKIHQRLENMPEVLN